MSNNIVIFGMAHSGKSTCGGYIYNELSKSKDSYDFEAFIERVKKNLLGNYDPSRDYGYLLDKGVDELYRTNTGTSVRLHLKRVNYNDVVFTIIDTPGAQHSENQRHRGMFYGDIGIFCMEISKILDERLFTNKKLFSSLISTLVLWSKYKKATIIALTKMDVCDYNETDYNKAKNIIIQLCNLIDVSAVIPIAINVKERKGHNIFTNSELMGWYKDKPLMEAIQESINNVERKKRNDKLLFTVDRSYLQPKQQTGKCWRIKILKGCISEGQKIALAPVQVNGQWEKITAVIKSIRRDYTAADGIEKISEAYEGSIVGIDLTDIYVGRKKISKQSMNTVVSSLGMEQDGQCIMSDTFVFCTSYINFDKMSIKRQMDLLWYGRSITFEIVEKQSTKEGVMVKGKFMNRKIAVPVSERGEYLNTSIVIRYDNNLCADPFIDAELVRVEGA